MPFFPNILKIMHFRQNMVLEQTYKKYFLIVLSSLYVFNQNCLIEIWFLIFQGVLMKMVALNKNCFTEKYYYKKIKPIWF